MIKPKILIAVFLIFFVLFPVISQNKKDTSSLISILTSLQTKFGYDFSYVYTELENIHTPKPSETLSFKETIDYLEGNTPFHYTILENNTVALSFKSMKVCGLLRGVDNSIISDATVQGIKNSTISNSRGEFWLTIDAPNEKIKIKYLGYTPTTISALDLMKETCKKIILTQKIESINEIILNDYLIKGINKQLDGSARIDYNNFGILPGLIEPDLLQTIQALPGILSVNETVSDINVRGGTNDQNLILWDGIKMYQSSHFFGLISAFNPYLTKNVQVFKNGSSAKYGDGVSSVIAMNTTNKINTELDSSVGVNLISVDGYIDTPISNKSSVQFAVRHAINDILETPTYKQYFDRAFQNSEVIGSNNTGERFSFYDASARWLYQLTSKDLIKVNALVMRNSLIFQENATSNLVETSRESSVKQNNIVGGILYQRNWSKGFQSELLLYGTNYKLEAINSDIQNNQRLLQENEVLENGIKLNTSIKTDVNINLQNGYQFNETGISYLQDVNNPTFKNFTKEVVRSHSLFSEIQYKLDSNAIYANLGARLNYLEKFNAYIFEPRFNFYKRFTNHFTLELLGEIKSQSNSQIINLQKDFLGIENRRWVLSNNEDIPIIKSKQASIGLSYNHNNWLITADAYYKNVKGIIARSQGFQNQFEFETDHGSYSVLGIDFLINKRFKNISTWLSYSYADNQYDFTRLEPSNFPNTIDIRHNINFAISYTKNNLKISGGINWHSGKPTTLPDPTAAIENDGISYLDPNSDRLDTYLRVDLSGTYSFNITKKIKGLAGVSIWNISNQENVFNNYFTIKDQNKIEEIKEFGLGFTPNAVFRLKF